MGPLDVDSAEEVTCNESGRSATAGLVVVVVDAPLADDDGVQVLAEDGAGVGDSVLSRLLGLMLLLSSALF